MKSRAKRVLLPEYAAMMMAEPVGDDIQAALDEIRGDRPARPAQTPKVKKLTAAKKPKQASVNPAASAWTREEKIEKLNVVIAATMDALELSPRVRLKILADCAERIKSGSVPRFAPRT